MHIDWATLATIAVVAAAAAVSLVLLVAFALVGFSPRLGQRIDGDGDGGGSVDVHRLPCSAWSQPGSSSATACI